MASQPTTNLQTHPVGTTGLNAILNGNWERAEAIFAPLAAVTVDATIGWDTAYKRFTIRAAQAVLTYSATPSVGFTGAIQQTLALTGAATLSTANLAAGRRATVVIVADASTRALAFPAWRWLGTAPTEIAANKTGLLELNSTGTADADVLARWTVQP